MCFTKTYKIIYGIEVKSGTEIKSDAFKHLEWFRDNLAKEKTFTGLILALIIEKTPQVGRHWNFLQKSCTRKLLILNAQKFIH